jgi:hypothetical protein
LGTATNSSEQLAMVQNMPSVKIVKQERIPFSIEEEAWMLEFIGQNCSAGEKKDWVVIIREHSKRFPTRKLQSLVMKYTKLRFKITYQEPQRINGKLTAGLGKLSTPGDRYLQEAHSVPNNQMAASEVSYDIGNRSVELSASISTGEMNSVCGVIIRDIKNLEVFGPVVAGKLGFTWSNVSAENKSFKRKADSDEADFLPMKCKKSNHTNSKRQNLGDNEDCGEICGSSYGGRPCRLWAKGSPIVNGVYSTSSEAHLHIGDQVTTTHLSEFQMEWLFQYVYEKWDLSNPENVSAIDWRRVCLKFEESFGFYPSMGYLLGSVIRSNFKKTRSDSDAQMANLDFTKSALSIYMAVKVLELDIAVSAVQIDRVENIHSRRQTLSELQVSSTAVKTQPSTDEGISITPGPCEATIPAIIPEMDRVKSQKSGLLQSNEEILKSYGYKGLPDDFTAEEHQLFQSLYRKFPKKWEKISEGMVGRDFRACIRHYYDKTTGQLYEQICQEDR